MGTWEDCEHQHESLLGLLLGDIHGSSKYAAYLRIIWLPRASLVFFGPKI